MPLPRIGLLLLLLTGCASAPPPAAREARQPTEPSEPPTSSDVTYVCFLVDGPAWRPGVPVGQQELGEHFAFVSEIHASGLLVANGVLVGDDDAGVRGMYVLAVGSTESVDTVFSTDPGVMGGVLRVEPGSVARWTLRYDRLGAPDPSVRTLWVADTDAAPPAVVDELAAQGALLTGGPLEGGPGGERWVLRATDAEEARALARRLGAERVRAWRMATRGSFAEARQRQSGG